MFRAEGNTAPEEEESKMIQIWRKGDKGAIHFTSPLMESCGSMTRITGKQGTVKLAQIREINKSAALGLAGAYGMLCKVCYRNMANLVNDTPAVPVLSHSNGEMPPLEEIADEAPVSTPAEILTGKVPARTREEWLIGAVRLLSRIFEAQGFKVPPVRISVGWPGGKSKKGLRQTIGQCWSAVAAADGIQQIFISPLLSDPKEILAVIMHELAHAVDGCKNAHKAAFKRIAVLVGLDGKMTATHAGATLLAVFPKIVEALGTYDHAKLDPGTVVGRVQTNKHLKMQCSHCDFQARTTQKQMDVYGMPSHCGSDMF